MTSPDRPPLSISFHNFWPEFVAEGSFFHRALGDRYDVRIEPAGRDLQIASVFGMAQLPDVPGRQPLRVWVTSEARDPHAQVFDLYFGFRPRTAILGERWQRYPLWAHWLDWWDEASPYHVSRLTAPRTQSERSAFCNFIYSADPSIRGEFFLRLNDARPVGSHGRVLNNTGARPYGREGKLAVLADSLFTIAFENQIAPGYVTEKLVEPLLAGSIPIYWGAAEARSDFNPDAFIFAEDFSSMDALVDHVLAVADSPARIEAYQRAPPFAGNVIPERFTPAFFVDRIDEALARERVARDHWPRRFVPEKRSRSLERRLRAFRDRLRG